MTAAGLTCELWVDGNRIADTGAALGESVPTALAGLEVSWGRSNSIDQPDCATCTFTVRDIGGDADFLGLLHTGHPITVWAAGSISTGAAPIDIADDGGFETAALTDRVLVAGGVAAAFTSPGHGGARAIGLYPSGTAAGSGYIGPAPFSTDPADWDSLPKTETGQQWTLQLSVKSAAAGVTRVAPWFATGPAAGSAGVTGPATTISPAPTQWQPYRATFTIDPATAGHWLGVVVTVSGFTAWQDWPGTWDDQTLRWVDLGSAVVDDLQVLAPPAAHRRVMVFSGRITDLSAGAAAEGVEVSAAAVDWSADLANDAIGDNPWLVETLASRVARILALASFPVTAQIDPYPAGLRVSWLDIDSQPVMDLLSDLAVSTDSVLWSAWHATGGFYLRYEDPALRAALRVLGIDPDTGLVTITGDAPSPQGAVYLTACDISNDAKFIQNVTDVITRVDLTYLTQSTNDQGQPDPTETHILLVDSGAEAEYGQRRIGYSTQLTTDVDGRAVANRVLNRSRALGWHADGLQWDTRLPEEFTDAHRIGALDLLDGSTRQGIPLVIGDMPAWAPLGDNLSTYVEGGTYTFEGGRWVLELSISPSGQFGASAAWVDMLTPWQWVMFDPAIAWFEMLGTTTGTKGLDR